MYPENKYTKLVEKKLNKININHFKKFKYSANPETLTGEIEVLTNYSQRKKNLELRKKMFADKEDAESVKQLEKLDQNIATRQNNFSRQCNFFSQFSEFFSNPIESSDFETAWLAFPILIKETAPFSRRDFQIYLEERNIQTRVVFTGNILRQPMMKGCIKRIRESGYPNADAVMRRGVLLPLHHGLTESMFTRFQTVVKEFVTKNV